MARFRRGGRRRRTFWLGSSFPLETIVEGIDIIEVASSAEVNEASEQPTLLRSLAHIVFGSDRSPDASQPLDVTYQWGLWCQDTTLGTTQVPDPANLGFEGWIATGIQRYIAPQLRLCNLDSNNNLQCYNTAFAQPIQWERYDLRSRRKMPRPCRILLVTKVTENSANAGDHKFTGAFRFLLAE